MCFLERLRANSKFAEFKRIHSQFYGILVIVWDDFINEPISALINRASGLFTTNSFAKNHDGTPMTFPNVDGVIIVRQLHQFQQAAGNGVLVDGRRDAFEYGPVESFPFKAFIPNPFGSQVPQMGIDCLHALPPDIGMGAEYLPSDEVMWIQIPDYRDRSEVADESVAVRAYELWQQKGYTHGHDKDDWFQAERELCRL